ncbi:MAG: DUF4188 domain-containing protein [Gammaproteobacteria bacterium]|nr:DUF4188 domain-containing protein [Gammaproteobacteria bacterium]
MSKINAHRMAAQIEGDFVVFLLGMRVNKFWKIHQWLPVAMAMTPMLKELLGNPESGLLGMQYHFGLRDSMLVQYWRSFEHLEAYARAKDKSHFPAWVEFNRKIGSNGDVGIWHETYKVSAGQYETVYNNMPAYGLGTAGSLVPATGKRETAKGRMGGSV